MNKYFNILSICALLLCTSCEKDTLNDNQNNGNGEAIPVNFVIGSIADMEDAQGTRSAEYTTQTFTQPLDPKEETGINVETTIEMLPYAEDIQTRSSSVPTGVIFRMEVFDAAGNSVSNGIFKVAGTSATLIEGTAPVLAPGTYNFVSYTFNTTVKDVEMNLDSSGSLSYKKESDGMVLRDFAIFSQRRVISAADNTVAINFKRQKSTIEFSAKAGDQTVSFTEVIRKIPRTIYWNLNGNTNESNFWTTEIGATQSFIPNSINAIIPFSDISFDNQWIDFTINGLNIDGVNYGTKVINAPLNIQPNKRYRIIFNFESTDIVVAGLTWAPGNLINVNGVYKFAASQNELGDKFNTDEKIDYCKLVAPENTWRMPTKDEGQNLIYAGLKFVDSHKRMAVCGKLILLSFFQSLDEEFNIFEYMLEGWSSDADGPFRSCLSNFETWEKITIGGVRNSKLPIRCVKN